MHRETKTHLLEVITKAAQAMRLQDYLQLRDLSDQTIHNSAVLQDEEHISLAVLLYSLFKIVEKNKLRSQSNWSRFTKLIEQDFQDAYAALNKEKFNSFKHKLRRLQDHIESFDANSKLYVREVLEQAKIQKGSRIVEHGLSAKKAAELLGVSQWELQNYLGYTKIPDLSSGVSVKDRLGLARRLFK